MSYALGVDIGTTFSAAAVYRQGRAEMVSLGYHSALVPSAVLITSANETLVGDAALRRGQSEPERLARFFKRRIGDSVPMILGGSPLSSETLTARLLRAVVDRVVEQQGGRPSQVAVTRPANWGPFKQDRFAQAVRLADLEDVVVLTEPEAAALAYAAEQRIAPEAVVAVYDLGGGTFDATVLRRRGHRFSVLGEPEGIERLGGIDFDAAVFEHVRQSLYGAVEALDEDDPVTLRSISRLRNECIEAKEALSSDTQVTIPVVLPGLNTEVRLTRSELEGMIRPALDDSIAALRRAVTSAGVEPAALDRVLLVGGSSRIPLVSQMVVSAFGRPVALDAHPKHAVALGAALVAGGEGVDGRAIGATHAVPTAVAATWPAGAGAASPPAGTPTAPTDAGAGAAAGVAAAGAGAAAAAAGAAALRDDRAPTGGRDAASPPGPSPDADADAGPPADQPFAPVGLSGLAGPRPAPAVSDGSQPAPAEPTTPPSGDGVPAATPSGPPSGDQWAPPAGPDAPTRIESGDAWAPPAGPDVPTRIESGDAWAPPAGPDAPTRIESAGHAPPAGPDATTRIDSGDQWAPPAGPDAPTRIESGDAWAPAASAAGPALDDTQVQSGDTWQTPTTPGTPAGAPSGDAWVPGGSPAGPPSGDAWPPGGSPGGGPSGDQWAAGGDDRTGQARSGAGLAAGAGAVGAGAAAAGAAGAAGAGPAYAAGAGPAYAETASASAPAGSSWGEAGPGSGSYPPGGGPSARHGQGGGDTRGRRWLVPAVAAVVAIALGVGAALTLAGDDDPGGDGDGAETATDSSTADDTAGDGDGSTGDTADDGDDAPPAMPTTLTEGGRQPLPSGGDGVTMDGSGRLWAATLVANGVVRMDTPWEADFGSVEIPMDDFGSDTEPLAILYAFDHIWVTLRRSSLLVKLDPDAASPEDPAVVSQVDTPGEPAAIREYAGYLWVISGAPEGQNGYLHRVDPATEEVRSVEIDRPNSVVVDDDDRVWVTHGDNLLQEYDLELNPVNEPIVVGDRPDEVVFTEGYIWTADRNSGTVSRIDRDSREVQSIPVDGNPAGLRADGNRLWVVDTAEAEGAGDGRLVLVDTDAMAVAAQTPVGRRPLGLHVDGDTVWVALFNEDDPAVVRVDAT